jgi:hypothetical protein
MRILPIYAFDAVRTFGFRASREFFCPILFWGSLVFSHDPVFLQAQEPREIPAERGLSEEAAVALRMSGFRPLCQFRSALLHRPCRLLTLQGWPIPDAYYCVLTELDSLQELHLIGTATRDQHLEAVSQISGLRSLDLRGNPITDASLVWLSDLPHLKSLDLRGTRVTEAAARDWNNQHPHIRVYHSACREDKQTVQLYAQTVPAASPLLRQE